MTRSILNKPSIPDPRIEQTDDQALGRPRVIYIGDKSAQKAGVLAFYLAFCSLFWPYSTTWLHGEIDLPTNLRFPTPELNKQMTKPQADIYTQELYIQGIKQSSAARVSYFTQSSAVSFDSIQQRDHATNPPTSLRFPTPESIKQMTKSQADLEANIADRPPTSLQFPTPESIKQTIKLQTDLGANIFFILSFLLVCLFFIISQATC